MNHDYRLLPVGACDLAALIFIAYRESTATGRIFATRCAPQVGGGVREVVRGRVRVLAGMGATRGVPGALRPGPSATGQANRREAGLPRP